MVLGLAVFAFVAAAIGLIIRLLVLPNLSPIPSRRHRLRHRCIERGEVAPDLDVERVLDLLLGAPFSAVPAGGPRRRLEQADRQRALARVARSRPASEGITDSEARSSMLTLQAWRNEAVLSLRQATGSRQPSPRRGGEDRSRHPAAREAGGEAGRRAQSAIWPSRPTAHARHSGR